MRYLIQPTWPLLLAGLTLGVGGWAAFMTVANNQEKLSSSVFRSIVRALRVDEQLREVLGEAIRPQPEWYLNGDPLVNGHVSAFCTCHASLWFLLGGLAPEIRAAVAVGFQVKIQNLPSY